MFFGTHMPKLDEKGRLVIPAKYRQALAQGVVITKGQDRCLYLFPIAQFEELAQRIQSAPMTSKNIREYQRLFLAAASDEIPDKQNRLTIPPILREYAGLDRDLVVTGVGSRLEIWDATAWNEYEAAHIDAYSELAEEVVEGSF